jgi:hypothetical protein
MVDLITELSGVSPCSRGMVVTCRATLSVMEMEMEMEMVVMVMVLVMVPVIGSTYLPRLKLSLAPPND